MADEEIPFVEPVILSVSSSVTNLFWSFIDDVGGMSLLAGQAIRAVFTKGIEIPALIDQIETIGLDSLSVATLTAIFSSMVMTVQFAVQMGRFGAKEYVGTVVSLSLVRELGPVLSALMVGGRVGAGIAAELGSMNVTEQVDAIRSMGADPVRKLVVPRMVAFVFVLPLLSAFADVVGVLGAMFIAKVSNDINMTYFYNAVINAVSLSDFFGGIAKTFFFGAVISLIACHQGLSTTGGTEGVGNSTTRTVVVSSVAVLICDFILTQILLAFGL